MRVKGNIERVKFKESVENRLLRIARCYRQLQKERAEKGKDLLKGSTPRPPVEGEIVVSLELNGYGRALYTKLVSTKLPPAMTDCFLWNLRGRKFFPPQDRRSVRVSLTFAAEAKAAKVEGKKEKKGKKKKAKKRKKRSKTS